MVDIVLVLAVFSALLVLVALSQPVAARLSLTPVVLLAAIGVTISAASGALLRLPVPHWFGGFERLFADLPLASEIFIYVFLPLLIFEAALIVTPMTASRTTGARLSRAATGWLKATRTRRAEKTARTRTMSSTALKS